MYAWIKPPKSLYEADASLIWVDFGGEQLAVPALAQAQAAYEDGEDYEAAEWLQGWIPGALDILFDDPLLCAHVANNTAVALVRAGHDGERAMYAAVLGLDLIDCAEVADAIRDNAAIIMGG